jgi:16S rRNA (cytosine967-C5)-methyltransferase
MDLFRRGHFTIQDESAALPTLLLDPRRGDRVLDMCAAPGGKTTHIAELMQNAGQVIALDRYDAKVRLIRGACERLGLRNVRIEVGDALSYTTAPVDRILLDAPCSGLGVLAKKPDMKWKRDTTDIAHLVDLQTQLLESAARLLRPGGVIVYSTCTMEPDENQQMIARFLERHTEFQLQNARAFVHEDLVSPEGYVVTYPHRHGMDGSFAARLVRAPG